MSRSYYVAGYWGPRAEPVSVCAERIGTVLRKFNDLAPCLQDWRMTASSEKEARESAVVDLDPDGFELSVRRIAGALQPEKGPTSRVGHSGALWNDAGASVDYHCGGSSVVVPNNFVVRLPREADEPRLYEPAVLESLLGAVIATLRPDVAVVQSDDLLSSIQETELGEIVPGVLTYISRASAEQLETIQANVREMPDGGVLVSCSAAARDALLSCIQAMRLHLQPMLLVR